MSEKKMMDEHQMRNAIQAFEQATLDKDLAQKKSSKSALKTSRLRQETKQIEDILYKAREKENNELGRYEELNSRSHRAWKHWRAAKDKIEGQFNDV